MSCRIYVFRNISIIVIGAQSGFRLVGWAGFRVRNRCWNNSLIYRTADKGGKFSMSLPGVGKFPRLDCKS
jgi:hypothetical protein